MESRLELGPHDALLQLGSDEIGTRIVVHAARCQCERGIVATMDAHIMGSLMTHSEARAEVILLAQKYGLLELPTPADAA